MKIRDDVELGQHSHVGMARTENQDFFGYWEPDDDRVFDLRGRLAVVCDGMGGHSGGEIASRMAVKAIIEAYTNSTEENVSEALRASIESANRTVHGEGVRLKELAGMGTTVTAVVQRRDMVYFGQVGDSRAYLIRGGQMKQMTKDHSLVQQLVDEGLLEESEMENHPDKNVILRSLGVKPEVEVDVSHIPVAPGDTFLICSDGLSGLVTNAEMIETFNKLSADGKSLRAICEELVNMANAAGGHDNITVQLLQVRATETSTTDATPEASVTQSFDEDEVRASIDKARAEAAARAAAAAGPGKSPKPAKPGPKASKPSGGMPDASPAAYPATQPAMPIPQLSAGPQVRSPLPFLGLGLVLGLVVGGLGVYGLGYVSARQSAEQAGVRAQSAVKASGAKNPQAAGKALGEGDLALRAGRFDEARAKYEAAAALAGAPGDGQ